VDLGFDVIKSAEVLAGFLRSCGENEAFKRPGTDSTTYPPTGPPPTNA
jgi:hypothetical protein